MSVFALRRRDFHDIPGGRPLLRFTGVVMGGIDDILCTRLLCDYRLALTSSAIVLSQ